MCWGRDGRGKRERTWRRNKRRKKLERVKQVREKGSASEGKERYMSYYGMKRNEKDIEDGERIYRERGIRERGDEGREWVR